MVDLPEVGLVLTVEKSALDQGSYKLLAGYAAENNLNLQLELGRFIISKQALPTATSLGLKSNIKSPNQESVNLSALIN